MMTPQQRVEEVKHILDNLDTDGFKVHDFVDLLDILNQAKTEFSHQLLEAHSSCSCNG